MVTVRSVIKGKDTQVKAQELEWAVVVDDSGCYFKFATKQEAQEFSEPYCKSSVGDGDGDMNVLIVPVGHLILEGMKEKGK